MIIERRARDFFRWLALAVFAIYPFKQTGFSRRTGQRFKYACVFSGQMASLKKQKRVRLELAEELVSEMEQKLLVQQNGSAKMYQDWPAKKKHCDSKRRTINRSETLDNRLELAPTRLPQKTTR